MVWLAAQALLGVLDFYKDLSAVPPRLLFLPVPALLTIAVLLSLNQSRNWLLQADLKLLTWLHVVRIPVELTLYLLFLHGGVPKIMTFEGANPDILSGISAIPVALLLFRGGKVRKAGLIIWNLACLALLVNIVYHAVFSTPYPFQKYGFEQPNVAIFYFPFLWLPAFVVPVVLLAHLSSLVQLLKK